MIRTQSRRLGRFKLVAQKVSREFYPENPLEYSIVKDFGDIYVPSGTDIAVEAIYWIAGLQENGKYKTPSLALALGTLVKDVEVIRRNLMDKKNEFKVNQHEQLVYQNRRL